jgi:hypothetical protein
MKDTRKLYLNSQMFEKPMKWNLAKETLICIFFETFRELSDNHSYRPRNGAW